MLVALLHVERAGMVATAGASYAFVQRRVATSIHGHEQATDINPGHVSP